MAQFTTSAAASPSSVKAGGTESIGASVTSATALGALVDVEIYNSAGAKVFQQWFDNQSFSAAQTRTYKVNWAVPSSTKAGTYTVKIGVFSPGWTHLYTWNNNAAQFTVKK